MNIVFIGAGNLATLLAKEMSRYGLHISQVYSRTPESAFLLANRLNCSWTTSMNKIIPDADWYIFSVKDDALPELATQLKTNGGLWLHTAGSVPATIFEGRTDRYGVIYPLQTFSKKRNVDFSHIPFIIEANNEHDLDALNEVCKLLTGNVHFLDSEKRKQIHLAAVFACNFANHMWTLAWKLLEEKEIPPEILVPLIEETAAKIQELTPDQAQTGPAIRYDKTVINRHLDMLESEDMKTIYRLLSQSIYKTKQV
ncbi:Rossmann-like and DUF2520 domain-containing protein [Massilibacteroides sp.]|uniref:Rossmann-like and DUF2520 domain-containing protein n=1 Tax=Massilibacteroides sp. TaxID=2034766 RepID=UPI002607E03D|nr:Rossmann-like and DUF2520 domain-containing protein [Massilibacteroides sp.]MDD4515121.1 F420-dependent NADP oxidoreductase [Massilibacteroides sp.]